MFAWADKTGQGLFIICLQMRVPTVEVGHLHISCELHEFLYGHMYEALA